MLVVAAVGLGIVLLALMLPRGFFLDQNTLDEPMVLPDTPLLANYLAAVLGGLIILGAVVTVVVALTGERIDTTSGTRRRYGPLAQMIIILFAILAAYGISTLRDRLRAKNMLFGGGGSRSLAPHEAAAHSFSHSLGIAVTVALAMVTVAIVVGAVWLLRRDRYRSTDVPEPVEQARIAVAEGLEELRTDREPREAIVACYLRMLGLADRSGVARQPSDTPLEVLARMLAVAPGTQDAAARLTALFERVRFSHHAATEEMRAEAMTALEDIRDRLDRVEEPV